MTAPLMYEYLQNISKTTPANFIYVIVLLYCPLFIIRVNVSLISLLLPNLLFNKLLTTSIATMLFWVY